MTKKAKGAPKTGEISPNTPAEPISTRRGLAKALGCHESLLRRLEARGDVPALADVQAWRDLIEGTQAQSDAEYKMLRNERLEAEVRLLKVKEQQQHGKLVEVAEVCAFLSRLGAKFDLLLTQKIDTEIPARLNGKAIVDARAEARAVHDEIREIVNGGLSTWEPAHD